MGAGEELQEYYGFKIELALNQKLIKMVKRSYARLALFASLIDHCIPDEPRVFCNLFTPALRDNFSG